MAKARTLVGISRTHRSESSLKEQTDPEGCPPVRWLWLLLSGSCRPAELIRHSQSLLDPKRLVTFTRVEEMFTIFGPKHTSHAIGGDCGDVGPKAQSAVVFTSLLFFKNEHLLSNECITGQKPVSMTVWLSEIQEVSVAVVTLSFLLVVVDGSGAESGDQQ